MDLVGLLPLVFIIVVFYLLLIRPQRTRQREMLRLQSAVAVGQEVMTTSGLFGTVIAADEETVTIETAPGVTGRWIRAAIGRIVSGEEPAADGSHDALPDEGPTGGRGPTA